MIFYYFILIIISCYWIMKACDPFEESANYLGRNMRSGIKGATINAIASSTPELLTTLIFLFIFNDKAGFISGIATIAGSAIFNAMIIPSFCIFVVIFFTKQKSIELSKNSLFRDCAFFLVSEILLIYLLSVEILTWKIGIMLIFLYLLYIIYMIFQQKSYSSNELIMKTSSKKSTNTDSKFVNFLKFDYRNMLHQNEEFTTKSAWIALIISVIHITAACYLLAEIVIKIAQHYNMVTFFVACIVAAIATSISDTIISIKDAKNDNYDDAISNAIGSNIFDVCICLGLPLIIYTIFYGPIKLSFDANSCELRFLLLTLTVFVICLLLIPKKVGIVTASCLFIGYTFSTIFIWSRGMELAWAKHISTQINRLFDLIN